VQANARLRQRWLTVQRAIFAAAALLAAYAALGQMVPWQPSMPFGPTVPPNNVLKGPVGNGTYIRVVIESQTVGIMGDQVTLIDSTVRAPVCVRTPGNGVTIKGNTLDCALCVEFTSNVIVGNTLVNNRCAGRGTNRPDIFGW
jgi:hypothetical protein